MKPIMRDSKSITDYYLDRDAATKSPIEERLYHLAWYSLEFYHGYRELEEMNLKLEKNNSKISVPAS